MADDQREIELRAARLRCRLVDATRELVRGLAAWLILTDRGPSSVTSCPPERLLLCSPTSL